MYDAADILNSNETPEYLGVRSSSSPIVPASEPTVLAASSRPVRESATTTRCSRCLSDLAFHLSMHVLDRPARVTVTTTITNVSEHPQPFLWGEHPAFLATPGDHIDIPPGAVVDAADELQRQTAWPNSPLSESPLDRVPSTRPFESAQYLPNRPEGWAALRRDHVGVALVWDIVDFPHLWLWRELGSQGFPSTAGPRSLRSSPPARGPVMVWRLRSLAGRPIGWLVAIAA